MAAMATVPAVGAAQGIEKNALAAPGQRRSGRCAERDRAVDPAFGQVDDLHGVGQIVGDEHGGAGAIEAQAHRPASQRNAEETLRIGGDLPFQMVPGPSAFKGRSAKRSAASS